MSRFSDIIISGDLESIEAQTLVVALPLLDGDLFFYDLSSSKILMIREQKVLERFEDNRGLYHRVHSSRNTVFLEYMKNNQVGGLVMVCPSYRDRTPITVLSAYNQIYILDLVNTSGSFIDVHESRGLIYIAEAEKSEFLTLPVEIIQKDQIKKLYDSSPETTKWSGSKTFNGLLIRVFEPDTDRVPFYVTYDPFAQWSSPRYLEDPELTELAPPIDDVAGMIEYSLNRLDWDPIFSLLPVHKRADVNWIASVIFEKIYHNDLYYGLSRQLWTQPNEEYSLNGNSNKYVSIDFFRLKEELRRQITRRLGLDVRTERISLSSSPELQLLEAPNEGDQDLDSLFKELSLQEEEDDQG